MSNRLRRTILLIISIVMLSAIGFLAFKLVSNYEQDEPKKYQPERQSPKEPIVTPDSQPFYFI